MVLEKFHLWIKVFGKKQSERMPIRKIWDHAIEVKKKFVPRKRKIYPLLREEREKVREFYPEAAEERVHLTIKITADGTGILHGEKEWKKENGPGLPVSE